MSSPTTAPARKKILIIDDEEGLRRMLKVGLQKSGCEGRSDSAFKGTTALAALAM